MPSGVLRVLHGVDEVVAVRDEKRVLERAVHAHVRTEREALDLCEDVVRRDAVGDSALTISRKTLLRERLRREAAFAARLAHGPRVLADFVVADRRKRRHRERRRHAIHRDAPARALVEVIDAGAVFIGDEDARAVARYADALRIEARVAQISRWLGLREIVRAAGSACGSMR